MRITRKALDYISSRVSDTSFETGGIIGSKKDEIITEIIVDEPENSEYRCYYAPNVKFLNRCIEKWQIDNVKFMGVFHTHFANVKTLSKADVDYINSIMKTMPENVKKLFFPIFILPNRELICYKATKTSLGISLTAEKLEIV